MFSHMIFSMKRLLIRLLKYNIRLNIGGYNFIVTGYVEKQSRKIPTLLHPEIVSEERAHRKSYLK